MKIVENIELIQKSLINKDEKHVLSWALKEFSPNIALLVGFNLAGVVIIDLLSQITNDFNVFSIDTGRLPEETYECAERINEKYGIKIKWFFPNLKLVEKLEHEKGLFSFKKSLEDRKECCFIRKVEPLSRALSGLDAWITGLRKDQSITRNKANLIEIDQSHNGMIKINPLINWTSSMVWEYVHKNNLPYNKLFDKGYTSIGCSACTRSIQGWEDERAGRWWWEKPEHKECGIHSHKIKPINYTI